MRAIRVHHLGDPEELRIDEIPDPVPGPGQVLVAVKAAGVNPVETYIRAGAHGYGAEVPYTPGSDAAGVVTRLGPGMGATAPGERVFTSGTLSGAYAELAVCDRAQVHPLPDRVSFAQGAAVGIPCAAAYRALFQRGMARAGETVLVHGATGGVGTAAVQLARAAGLTVFGTAGDRDGRELVGAQGAHQVFDHEDPEHLEEALDATDGRGVDLVLEMLANANLGADLGVLGPGARVVVIGSRGTVEINPRDLMVREAEIRGLMLARATDAERREIYRGLGEALAGGALVPLVGAELPLEQAPEAHRQVASGRTPGKVVLIP